jgi:hypothetical protein
MAERKRLSDILSQSGKERIARVWDETKPADELRPLPAGTYRCCVLSGELSKAKTGTVGYKITLEVLDGEHADRRLWHDIWLSEAALPLAKRDLLKLGIERLEQLDRPLPKGIFLSVRLALRRNDDGSEYNRVTGFDVIAVEPPEPDPFAPSPSPNGEPPSPLADRGAVDPHEGGHDDAADCDRRDQQGFDWAIGEQEDRPAASRGRGAYSET